MQDVIGEIFRLTRLTSCVYFQRDFCAPWAMNMCAPGLGQFHIIIQGMCTLAMGDHQISCNAGDVLFLPHGDEHVLADPPGTDPVPGLQVLRSLHTTAPLFSNGQPHVRLICGHFECQHHSDHLLFSGLPSLIHIKASEASNSLRSVVSLLMDEIDANYIGSSSIVERYAEILLIEVLRRFAVEHPARTGLLHALRDPRLYKAIHRIHLDFSSALSIDQLASEATLSRSAFVQQFRASIGMPPVVYLARWRLLIAAEMLRDTDLMVDRVATSVGYGSSIAFTRAFKREYGVPPSRYRQSTEASSVNSFM